MDAYYGRARNITVPGNAAVLAKAAALRNARAREQQQANDTARDRRDEPRTSATAREMIDLRAIKEDNATRTGVR